MRKLALLLALNAASFALSPSEEAKVKALAREYIKDHLKAPATAIFSKESVCAPLAKVDFEEVKGTGPTPECKPQTAAKVGDGPASVVYRASVDAQNSYGALLRTKFQLQIYFVDGKWTIRDSAESVKLLRDSCIALNAMKAQLGQRPTRDCDAEFPSAK